jgi:hypothetical protein
MQKPDASLTPPFTRAEETPVECFRFGSDDDRIESARRAYGVDFDSHGDVQVEKHVRHVDLAKRAKLGSKPFGNVIGALDRSVTIQEN